MRVSGSWLWAGVLALAVSVGGQAQTTQTPSERALPPPPEAGGGASPTLEASGQIGFGLKVGLGDGRGLARQGYSQGLEFNQLLALNLEGGVPVTLPFVSIAGLLTISAQLNSQQADNLQSLKMHFDSEHWTADFGDFVVGQEAPLFIVPDRQLKGFKLQGRWSDLAVTGAFARVEGLAESKVFRGNTSNEVVTFSHQRVDRPWLEAPYLRNLRGLAYFELSVEFVEGFTQVKLNLNPSPWLGDLLDQYGLGYLFPGLKEAGPTALETGQFEVVRTEGRTFLVLKRAPLDLARDRLRNAIEAYNREHDLPIEERREYPFNEDTDYELGFLEALQGQATLDVDGQRLALGDFQQRRFFFLGHTEVDANTLVLEVFLNGEFTDVTDPLLFDYRFDVFAKQGLVELDFPPAFFEDPDAQLRASYNYTSTSGVYILGLSIVKESERVFLNGQPLQRDVDYTVDYETGALILFQQVGPDDVLRIEYEVLRGGLGGFTEYRRNLSQLSVALAPAPWLDVKLDLFQGADGGGGQDRERLHTMPNTHTVAGLRTTADLGPFQAALTLGGALDAYPFDDNLRANLPNRLNAIAALDHAGRSFVLFAHQNGLTVFDGARWTLYDTRAGLSGRSVNDVAVSADWVALATESGVTLIQLRGEDPFAVATNWRRFYQQDGLAHNRAYAVALDEQALWVGTQDGMTRIPLDALDEPKKWSSYRQETHPELISPAVTELALARGLVYLGSEQGLQVFDPLTESFRSDPGLAGGAVHDLVSDGQAVYAAGDWGVRVLSGAGGSGWLLTGEPAYALALRGLEVWVAPERGLRVIGPGRPPRELEDQAIRALGTQGHTLWVGPRATVRQDARAGARYDLSVWELTPEAVRALDPLTTRIDGRDLNRFQDVPLGDHLDLGGLSQLALSYRGENFTVTSALEGLSAQFTPVGGTARQDYLRWRLSGDYDLSSALSLSAEHTAGLVHRNFTVTDQVGITWGAGPQLKLDYSEQRSDTRARRPGFDRLSSSLSLSASQRLFGDALELQLGLEDKGAREADSERLSQDLTLTGSAGLALGDALDLSLDLRSPLRMTRFRDRLSLYGSGQLGGRLRWSPQFSFGDLVLDYRRDDELRFPQVLASSNDSLEAQFNWGSFSWAGPLWVPRSTATFSQGRSGRGDALTQLSLENSVLTRWQDLSTQLRWKRDWSFDARSQRGQTQDLVALRLDYSGLKSLTPGLGWTLNLDQLHHPVLGEKFNWTHQLDAHLSWKPQEKLSVDSSLSWELTHNDEERSAHVGLQTTTSYQLLEPLGLSLVLNGDWKRGVLREEPLATLSFDATLQGNWKLSQDWSSSFTAGLLWGRDAVQAENGYLSYLLSANASMAF